MRITNLQEIEHKFDASGVNKDDFMGICLNRLPLRPIRFYQVKGPDVYYSKGEDVIRHRIFLDKLSGELTVKTRKSSNSLEDRNEIDLDLGKTEILTVHAFLSAIGFRREFTIIKDALIFEYDKVSVVLYSAHLSDDEEDKRHFLEIEIDKNSGIEYEEAVLLLNSWSKKIEFLLSLSPPRNRSLYEIFSCKPPSEEGILKAETKESWTSRSFHGYQG